MGEGRAEVGKIKDVFDGKYYKHLLQKDCQVNGHSVGAFFSGKRDLALGLSSDSFSPFKKRKHLAWPLIVFNYNFSPLTRFRLNNILCLGVIPGPRAPKDIDSFLVPLVDELMLLAQGIKAFDRSDSEFFDLRAHLIKVFGDMPAMAKLMWMKGHNAIKPCRMCNIYGLRTPGSCATSHYVPLNRSQHPECGDIRFYRPNILPKRTHEQILSQAREIQEADTRSRANALSTEYGINGHSQFHWVPSIKFPECMPHDFMHLIWENLIKNLIALWTGNYKDLGNDDYTIPPDVWRGISEAAAASGSTIPSTFGAKVPDFSARPSEMIAETWSFFMLHLAPILLHGKFPNTTYYHHFIQLVNLLHLCMSLEITEDQVDELDVGFCQWAIDYER